MWTTTLWIVHIVHELYIIARDISSHRTVLFRHVELFSTSLLIIFPISKRKSFIQTSLHMSTR